MSFLNIPTQEGLFKIIKTSKSASDAEGLSRTEDNDDDEREDADADEDDDDDDSQDVRFIPRCSPVPRKRGASIFDETAEYMRIHRALAAGKRVSFADTTGGDLVDVLEFVAFDSDEEDSARWEQEEAKYRRAEREPTYTVHPEFNAPTPGVLLQAVRSNKVEVERISAVEEESLAFSGGVRVLNVSFHKAVYVRSSMDGWATYFDHPAEYVPGSHDGETDQFSFKLSFAPPFNTHGSRIEFVVRYETPDGDYWANNASMNYAVTLLLSYEDDGAQASSDVAHKRSILKTPKFYSMDDDMASEIDQEKGEAEEPEISSSHLVRPSAVYPVIKHPEIDVEEEVPKSAPPEQLSPSVGGASSTPAVVLDEHFPSRSSDANLQTSSAFALHAGDSVLPDKPQPSHVLQWESKHRMSEWSVHSSPTGSLSPSSPSSQEFEQRSDESQAEIVESPASEAPLLFLPVAEMTLASTAGEEWKAAESVSCHSVTDHLDRRPDAEIHASLKAGDPGPLSLELTEIPSVNTNDVSQDVAPQAASAWNEKEKEDFACIPLQTSLENSPNMLSDVLELVFAGHLSINLMPCIFFLGGIVSLSLVMQAPSALFLIGLLLVLYLF